MIAALLLLFIVVPIVELAIILEVGGEIGPWWTIALLVTASLLGSVLMRSEGRAAWRRFTDAARMGRPPAREVLDGALIIAGGALLLTPGFLTDALGLLLLVPPSRALIRRMLARQLANRVVVGLTRPPRGAPRRHGGDHYEGSATDVPPSGDAPRRRLP